ncbi:neuropeptides capa receptor [Nomia melanderi]|uniref:neuropeptides capa receptor n=1 Tax=Nomia melanderi TaxID=2448451 RepID=UPI001304068E|nr:neuropeptides capa receptor-like [Nomia melanderi]
MNASDELSSEITTEYELLNETEYLEEILGIKYLPLELVVPITLVYIAILAAGIVGNLATCIVIYRQPYMQTPTNCYLFNLALSDLLLLLWGIPFELSQFWEQYPWIWGLAICKLRAYISESSSYVSVLTIVAFSLERYLAICHPLRRYASGIKGPVRVILAAWLVALVFAVPFALYTTVSYVKYPPGSNVDSLDSAMCTMQKENIPEFPLYELSCLVFFLLPMAFIAVLYTRMGLRIQSTSLEGAVHGETTQAHSRRTIIRMLGAVVITFFICWAPFHAQRLMYVYLHESKSFADINTWLYLLSGCLYYFSTTVNPILYNLMSARYRDAFKETLCCCPSRSSITRLDLSSVRDTSGARGFASRTGSQVFCRRNTSNQRSIKYNASIRAEKV